MKPLLAHIYEPRRVSYPCFVQPKLNGIRALYQDGNFQTRDELPWPPLKLAHIALELGRVAESNGMHHSTILDGELYIHGWPLQEIMGATAVNSKLPNEKTLQVEYHVFDVVNYTDSFVSRSDDLSRWIKGMRTVKKVPTVRVIQSSDADLLYSKWVSEGYEGMMYRTGFCPYTLPKQLIPQSPTSHRSRTKYYSDKDNRCWHLLKRKSWQDAEFPWTELVEGEGKLRGMLGAFVCKTPEGKLFNVGSGLTDLERQHYWAHPPTSRLIKVKFLCLSTDLIPLNPTIEAIL